MSIWKEKNRREFFEYYGVWLPIAKAHCLTLYVLKKDSTQV